MLAFGWCAAAVLSMTPDNLLTQYKAGNISRSDIFISMPLDSDEMLFVVDDEAAPCGPGQAEVDVDGSITTDINLGGDSCIPVIGYIRSKLIAQFHVNVADSVATVTAPRHHYTPFSIDRVQRAPTFSEMAANIHENPKMCLSVERGDLFEAYENLCFALGYKHVLVRQQLMTGPGHSELLNGMPYALFCPHVYTVLEFLLKNKGVWTSISNNHFGYYERSFIFAHPSHRIIGEELTALKTQDGSIPGQPDQLATCEFIVFVGSMLGYPHPMVEKYSLEMLPDLDPSAGFSKFESYLASLPEELQEQFVVGENRLSEVPGTQRILLSDAPIDTTKMREAGRLGSWLFPELPAYM